MVTVDLDKDSLYDGPRLGTFRQKLHEIKMYMAYRHYHHLLKTSQLDFASTSDPLCIVDVGCGPGYLLRFAEAWFSAAHVIGIEYDPRLLETAKRQVKRTTLLTGNAETLPLDSNSVDIVASLHVIEHLYRPVDFIREAARVLKPKGLLLLATPNPAGIGAKLTGPRWTGWREDHVSLFPPRSWVEMASSTGFLVVKTGTSGLSGLPLFRRLPLAVINYTALALWGVFPWEDGEAFVGLFRKP